MPGGRCCCIPGCHPGGGPNPPGGGGIPGRGGIPGGIPYIPPGGICIPAGGGPPPYPLEGGAPCTVRDILNSNSII